MNTGMRPLADNEIHAMLSAMAGGKNAVRNQCLLHLGVFTGFRISELLSLRIRDVWDGFEVRSTVTVGRGYVKGKKESRTLPLNPAAASAIKRWLRCAKRDNPLYLGWFLFTAQGSRRPISRQLAARVLAETAERAGIDSKRIATHSMRKTFANKAWNSAHISGDMAKMAQILGHKNWSNTLRYLEFLDGSIDRAVLEMGVGGIH